MIYFLEDDLAIAYVIEKTLKNAGFSYRGFQKGMVLLEAYKQEKPSLVLLDIMLPDISGLEVLKRIRALDGDIPIIMISALSTEMDKVKAIDLGADDYLTKPFGVLELTSRIQARLRKIKPSLDSVEWKDLKIDHAQHTFYIGDHKCLVTPTEFDIISYLLQSKDQIISKDMLIKHIWKTDYVGDSRSLDVHMKSIRQKLKLCESQTRILTIRGIGYQIV